MFNVTPKAFFGTTPTDSSGQALVAEIIISFLLMFVISGVATDSRAVSVFNISNLCFFHGSSYVVEVFLYLFF